MKVAGYRLLFLGLLIGLLSAAALAQPSVWFTPADETADFLTLFEQPDLWARSRSQIQVFKFGPKQVGAGKAEMNSLQDLEKVDAFRKLQTWGIAVAIEAPSVKPWDCTAVQARKMTVNYIKNVKKANGVVRYIAMDEPMAAGFDKCSIGMEEIADRTARYITELSTDPELQALGSPVEIGDIEGYPRRSVQDIEHFVKALESRGAKLAFFHIDANIHRLDVLNAHGHNEERNDLRELQRFFRAEGISFGVIFWPGYNPVSTEKIYYDRTMAWVRRVHQAIGKPDQCIFQSWIVRGGLSCSDADPNCNMQNPMCSSSDRPDCGKKSVPVNLPENDPEIFSATRLLNDGLRVLNGH